MKRKLAQISLAVGALALFLWAITNSVESIAYGIDSGDALGAMLCVGIPILPILAYMYFIHKVSKWLHPKATNS